MFAPDDYFLTTLKRLLRTLSIYPLFGRGRARLQPVHVEDVGEAIARILGLAAGSRRPYYELGGPHTYTFAELVRSVADGIGTRPWLVPLPFALWEAVALLSEFAPSALITRNLVRCRRIRSVAFLAASRLRSKTSKPTSSRIASRPNASSVRLTAS